MLIDIVGVDQRGGTEGVQQVFRKGFNQRLGAVAKPDAGQVGGVGLFPLGKQGRDLLVEAGKFGMAEDGGLNLAGIHLELAVADPHIQYC